MARAAVSVDEEIVGRVGPGIVVLLGVRHDDSEAEAEWLARKIWEMRIFAGERSASQISAPVLVVSQFTLYGDVRKGRRPSWSAAAPGAVSEPLYEHFCSVLRALGAHVECGIFGAEMSLDLVNDGPFTLVLER